MLSSKINDKFDEKVYAISEVYFTIIIYIIIHKG